MIWYIYISRERQWVSLRGRKITAMGNRTVGIEIECFYPSGNDVFTALRNVANVTDDYYSSGSYTRWIMKDDCTICTPNHRSYSSTEIVSPILTGMTGVREIGRVVRTIRDNGARVNHSTGAHVHVG